MLKVPLQQTTSIASNTTLPGKYITDHYSGNRYLVYKLTMEFIYGEYIYLTTDFRKSEPACKAVCSSD